MHSHAKATNVDAALVQYSPCLYTHSANKLIPVPDYFCLIVSVKVGGVLRLLQIRAVNIFVLAQRGNHGYQDFLISINKVLAMRSNRYVQVRQTPMLLFKPMRHLFLDDTRKQRWMPGRRRELRYLQTNSVQTFREDTWYRSITKDFNYIVCYFDRKIDSVFWKARSFDTSLSCTLFGDRVPPSLLPQSSLLPSSSEYPPPFFLFLSFGTPE